MPCLCAGPEEEDYSAEAAMLLAQGAAEEGAAADALYEDEYGHDTDW